MTMRICRQAFALAAIFSAAPSHAESLPPVVLVSDEARQPKLEPDVDIFALMSGKCPTLKVAGRDFRCRSVAFFHSLQGRANFSVALEDPDDNSHIISFSGANGYRTQDDVYELTIDRMLLKSKHRPKVDGLPVPAVESSVGSCRQIGNFVERKISGIFCTAVDNNGNRYELRFESDGSRAIVRRVRQSAPTILQQPFE